MKISYADNGWTVFVDENITTLTNDQIIEIGKLVVRNMVVVFKDQTLTPEEELRICNVIGKFQHTNHDRAKHITLIDGVLRVTGKKNEYGEEGLFGHKAALDWHANQPSNPDRKPMIWLYGEQGTKGSRTSWINNIAAYNALSNELKEKVNDIKLLCGYKPGNFSDSTFFNDHVNFDNPINLVRVNEEGQKGLFFPFLQIFGFVGYSESDYTALMDELIAHVLQEQFAYHHDWDDGDIVISEQWLSIHKRWEFEGMGERVLHRIAFGYENIYKK
jgi:taurine dioxygenase